MISTPPIKETPLENSLVVFSNGVNEPMIAVLHNIRSLHNVGSMFRTADAVGVEKIYLSGITPSPVDRFGKFRAQFTKVSLGGEKTVAWDYSARSPRAMHALIRELKKDGYAIFALEQSKNSIPYYTLNPKRYTLERVALIVGNEVRGIPPTILRLCDAVLEIPMRGAVVLQSCHSRHTGAGKESLNVAVAFGIVAYALAYGFRK